MKQKTKQVEEEPEPEVTASDDDSESDANEKKEEDDNENENGSGSSSEDGSERNSEDDSDSDSDDDNEEEEEEEDAAHHMDKDILKVKSAGDTEKKENEEEADENMNDDDNDGDDQDLAPSSDEEDEEEKQEAKKADAFFESQSAPSGSKETVELFVQLTLSRPLLRGIAAMGFVKPTPIQASCIPVALSGRDICASAVTGSGKTAGMYLISCVLLLLLLSQEKLFQSHLTRSILTNPCTAAFSLPILERLLHRTSGSSRALILAPTRELAAQCLGMIGSLAQFTRLRAALIVGGSKNVASQAAELRSRPDIIVATPGRLLDHVTNSSGVTLEDLEFLVLDEADRLLDLGFQEEIFEIIKSCPVQRQTLLFSATMNTKVDDLIKLSLKRPVRIRVSDKNKNAQGSSASGVEVAPHLEQEFIRIRSGNEGVNREAILVALLTRTFTSQTIVFFDTKVIAHRIMILCGLCGIKCTELHGNLTQAQRLTALESFRKGEVNVLLATDLAGRGIDIPNVETVINFEMPAKVSNYIHRIGRTARAGRGGRACTLIGEGRRHLMKSVIKDAAEKKKQNTGLSGGKFKSGTIRSRSVPSAVVAHFVQKIQAMQPHVTEVMQAEAVAHLDRLADMEAAKAQNLIEHSSEIEARPRREWFASNQQKKLTKEAVAERQAMIREKAGTGVHRMTRKKRRKREALEAITTNEDSGDEGPRKDPEDIVKATAKAAKRKQQKKDREAAANESLTDKLEKAYKKKRKTGDAVGDSSLFDDENVAHSKKASIDFRAVKSSYKFRDSEPEAFGQKKGKKKGNKAFKSKAKHKRRK